MLLWRCNCADGSMVHHIWSTERCAHCGAARDDCVRAERQEMIYATLTDSERVALDALHARWQRGELD